MSYHVMLDLETLGNGNNAVIVAIGAVLFNPARAAVDRVWSPSPDTFYARVDPQSCIDAGLQMDASTVMWWLKQEDAARLEIVKAEGASSLLAVLQEFARWYTNINIAFGTAAPQNVTLWGNGATLDNVILANAYRACGLKQPWSHRADRCYRTLRALFPDVAAPSDTGTKHNALDDAIFQAKHLSAIFQAQGWA